MDVLQDFERNLLVIIKNGICIRTCWQAVYADDHPEPTGVHSRVDLPNEVSLRATLC
jgi:hypothetical protein